MKGVHCWATELWKTAAVSHSHRSPDDEDLNPRYRLIVSSTSALDIGGHIEGVRFLLFSSFAGTMLPSSLGQTISRRSMTKYLQGPSAVSSKSLKGIKPAFSAAERAA